MEIFGRLTADAKVNALKDGRKVVNFSVALNDSYKSKGSDEIKKTILFFNCSYWINPAIASFLTKGTIVELQGRLSVNAYNALNGDAKASLNFHVSSIKLHGKGQAQAAKQQPNLEQKAKEDLPF
jgi:single-strand DNA-binding protein